MGTLQSLRIWMKLGDALFNNNKRCLVSVITHAYPSIFVDITKYHVIISVNISVGLWNSSKSECKQNRFRISSNRCNMVSEALLSFSFKVVPFSSHIFCAISLRNSFRLVEFNKSDRITFIRSLKCTIQGQNIG